ncbi:MAG: hypothetical protein D6719_01815 [Candidatus Dadabacteria bacterium]|nr:MAG: hypothetical protein D6719_01815 [Candidatus Dadabacteria bacterium]
MSLINFSGIASGIDSAALIDAILEQQRAIRITPLEDKISTLEDTNSAFGELTTLLSTLQDAASKFRTVNGGALSKTASSSDETVLSAVAGNSATNGSYTLSVTQLASNATYSFASTAGTYTSTGDAISSAINNGAAAADRTVSVTVGSGADAETTDIVLTNSTTLQDFVDHFNAASSKATAAAVNVGTSSSPDYRIVITSNSEGLEKGQVSVTVGSEITANSAFDSNTVDQATDATFSMSGVSGTITRSTNSISDLIPGVTFNLQSIGSATVTVSDDSDATASAVQDFVDAYNAVVEYIKDNDTVTRQEDGDNVTNIFGPLAETSIDDNILSSLRSALTSAGISGSTVNIFADLGITTERDGTLKFDQDTFTQAVSDDPESVKTILANAGETLSAVDGTIAQYIQFNGIIDQAENSNTELISSYNNQIADAEKSLSRQEETLRAQFARLEALIGRMNSQSDTLLSILPS